MKAGRQLDAKISSEAMGYTVTQVKREIYERTEKGTRPLKAYSTDVAAAWEVVEKFGITLIPIEGNAWFAFVGNRNGWKSPAEFLESLQRADFMNSGAAVSDSPALSICMAALRAVEKRAEAESQTQTIATDEDSSSVDTHH